jgi:rhodanese-related sulfurtransferase
MNWTNLLVFFAVLAILLLMKRAGRIAAKQAREHLKNGARLIDVRTASEYNSEHLKSALNVPLDEIESALPRLVKDKSQVLLLHCQSGMRSGAAKKKLNALGYANSYNIGSFARAREIVDGK